MRKGDMTFRAVRILSLVLVATLLGGPIFAAEPIDRAELTGRLVPVTGERTRSLDLTVPFERDSAKLTKEAKLQLDELAAALSGEKLRKLRVEVYGHTDASGLAAYNLKLSKARAAETVRYLVERHGLDLKRFRYEGYGEERLLTGFAPRSTRNRRVEIVVVNNSSTISRGTGTRPKEKKIRTSRRSVRTTFKIGPHFGFESTACGEGKRKIKIELEDECNSDEDLESARVSCTRCDDTYCYLRASGYCVNGSSSIPGDMGASSQGIGDAERGNGDDEKTKNEGSGLRVVQ